MNILSEICKAFGKEASRYEKHAVAQKEIGQRLFERLDYLKISPRYLLDLGCGPGYFSALLKKRYPEAIVVGLDLSVLMLKEARNKEENWPLLAADMHKLPFESGLFDLVFANQVIHWSSSLPTVFREINRIMHPGACLMFSALGPDTFIELRNAWREVDAFAHANDFVDMHDLGDLLMNERFLEPVMDMESLTLHYPSLQSLIKSLKAQGVPNINPARNPGLTGKKRWKDFERAFEASKTVEGKFPLSYEVLYGHAWKGVQRNCERGVETFIPIDDLLRNR